MAPNRTYKLPWKKLDREKIIAAASLIADSLPKVKVEVEAKSPTSVRCYFAISRDLARQWEGPELDRWYASGQPPVADPLWIEIAFLHLESDPQMPTDLFLMEADMGHSSNRIVWNLAVEILNRYCQHWQIEPERW